MNTLAAIRKRGAVSICAMLLALVISVPAAAIEDGGIGSKPAKPRADNPRSSSIFVYEPKPGDVITDEVQVINNTSSPKTLLIYAVDSQVASGGAFACAQKVDQSVSVGSWIKVSESEVTLAPNSFKNVPFTIAVPATASAGESNGCIVVQDAQRSVSSENGGITLSFRTAIRVALTIPGDISKSLAFTGLAAKAQDKKVKLSAGLKNNGNVSIDADLRIRLQTFLGTTVQNAGGTFPVLARSEGGFNFEVEQPFWGGWYKVVAEATYNSDKDASIGEGSGDTTIHGPAQVIFIAPQPVALAVEAVLTMAVLGGVLWLVLRRLHLKKLHSSAKLYTVKPGDTLHSIAKAAHVPWRRIATLNKLKPPYHLEPGRRIKLPHR